MKIGIDAGGTLIKIVQDNNGERVYTTKSTTEIDDVISWLNQQNCESISLTGGQAALIQEHLTCPSRIFVEFDAAAKV